MRIDVHHHHHCCPEDPSFERKLDLIIVALNTLVDSVSNIENFLLAPTIVFTPSNPKDKDL